MEIMTPQLLLQAVTELTASAGHPVATGDEIKSWCNSHSVDWGAHMNPRGKHFWLSDHKNAPTPLRKWKRTPLSHTGLNGWCLVEKWSQACAWSALQTPRWYAIPWSAIEKNWMWKKSKPVDASTPLATFDESP